MSPAPPKPAIAKRDQGSNGKHKSVPFLLPSGLVDEGADAGILVVDEISFTVRLWY